MSRVHTRALAIASLAAIAALTACSSSGNDASKSTGAAAITSSVPDTSSSTPMSADPTSSVPAGGTTSSPAMSAPPAGNTACAESQLKASIKAQDLPEIGYHVLRLIFTNTSNTSCTITGYPGAAIVDETGKQVQQAKRTVGGPVAGTVEKVGTIPVAPGRSVFAYLEGKSTKEQGAAQAGCDNASYPKILITPPNTKIAVPFTVGWPLCYAFNVHPVRSQ